MNPPADSQAIKLLLEEMEKFNAEQSFLHAANYHANWILILVSLTLVVAIVIAGIRNKGKWAAIFGVINGFVIAVQSAYAFDEIAEFRRVAAGEVKNIALELRTSSKLSDEEFRRLRSAFTKVREHTDQRLPRGKGMQAALDMRDDVQGKSTAPQGPALKPE